MRALRLYRGRLLSQEYSHWTIEPREQLRSRFVRLAIALGRGFEDAGNLADAIALYEDCVRREPTAEVFYRALMRCLKLDGREAEAHEVYTRCRHVLSASLGRLPSAETQDVLSSAASIPSVRPSAPL
jgi:two-component SAPR family response regulator